MAQIASDSTLNQFFDLTFCDFVQPNQNFDQSLPPLYESGLNVGWTQVGENRVDEIHREQGDSNFNIGNDPWGPCSSFSWDPCSSSSRNYEMHQIEQQEMDLIVLLQSDVWGSISDQGLVTHITGGNFAQSSITINGWLRDFLWAQMEKLKMELERRSRDYWSDTFCIVEQGMHRILVHKDQEIEKLRERNTALEEKVKTLAIESQIWKKVSQTNEATVISLRRDLEIAQIREGEGENVMEEDAVSSCEGQKGGNHICHCCRSNEISILVLPCRHLCLCSECDRILGLCPICMSTKTASIKINMP